MIKKLFYSISYILGERGIINHNRGKQIAELSWPRIVTMFARFSQHLADVAMIGFSIGASAVAGIGYATVYWQFGVGLSVGLVGATISQVSQAYGAKEFSELELYIKQSLWIGVLLSIPAVLIYSTLPNQLISILTSNSEIIGYGATYLEILSIAIIFLSLNLVSSRTLAGVDDTWLTMVIRTTGSVINIVLNMIFIFVFQMGIAGAALGTVISEITVTILFLTGFIRGRLPVGPDFPVTISVSPPYFDYIAAKQLLQTSGPLMIQMQIKYIARFPLFALLGFFGPSVVAAYEVARRVRNQLNAAGRGFNMATSTLVGQQIGQENNEEASGYAIDAIIFSSFIYLISAFMVFILSPQISKIFASHPAAISQISEFIRIAAVSAVGLGIYETFSGILKAAGDNKWTMYGQFIGLYVVFLPLLYLATVTPAGIVLVYIGFIFETWFGALATGYRYWTGSWQDSKLLKSKPVVDD